jgi:hypothetical protein
MQKPRDWDTLPLNEKIRLYALQLDHTYAPYVDKLEAKRITEGILPSLLTAPVLAEVQNAAQVMPFLANPPTAILKSAHASGWNIALDNTLTEQQIQHKLAAWNRLYKPDTQTQYAHLTPRFFVERLINAGRVWVVMVRCIHGKPIAIGLTHSTAGRAQNYYDVHWKPMQRGRLLHAPTGTPRLLPRILDIATQLAQPFEFVRIDLMLPDLQRGPIYFGEYTFTPKAGKRVYHKDIELTLGKHWK